MGGWPFLIARGRRQGYRVLLAPDVLPTYGFLDDDVLPTRPGARYQAGRVGEYFLVWNEYPLAEGEVGGPVRDEHSRPLVLTVGVLYPGDTIADDTELPRAHRVALDTYRRFLADEEGFRVERSAQFDPPVRAAPPVLERPTAHPEELAYAASRPLPPPPTRSANRTLVAGGVGVAVVAAIAVVLALSRPDPDLGPPPPPPCPTTTTPNPGTTTTPSARPTVPTPAPAPTPTPTPTCVP